MPASAPLVRAAADVVDGDAASTSCSSPWTTDSESEDSERRPGERRLSLPEAAVLVYEEPLQPFRPPNCSESAAVGCGAAVGRSDPAAPRPGPPRKCTPTRRRRARA